MARKFQLADDVYIATKELNNPFVVGSRVYWSVDHTTTPWQMAVGTVVEYVRGFGWIVQADVSGAKMLRLYGSLYEWKDEYYSQFDGVKLVLVNGPSDDGFPL